MVTIVTSAKQPINVRDGKDAIIEQIISLIEQAIEKAGVRKEKVLGVGLAIPGPCNYEKGIMINPPNFPGWLNVPIKEIVSRRLGFPVYTSKETSCAVLSEYWFGEAAETRRIFGMTIGDVGIGGALVLDGKIFQEEEGESMDVGHTIVQVDGYPCSCGNNGCLEQHASGYAAVRYAEEMIRDGEKSALPEKITYQDIIAGVRDNDWVSIEAVKKCAFYLSVAVLNILALLSPQRICMGGNFISDCPLMYEKIVEYIERKAYPASAKEVIKSRFAFGEMSGAMGGLALVFDALSRKLR